MSSTEKVASSGITTNSVTGERHIPASTRADGSTRREIRIRPGYRPPEDVEVYRNRTAEAWKNRGSGGIPGAEGLKDDSDKSAASTKNAKRREAKKKAAAAKATDAGGDAATQSKSENIRSQENWRGAQPEPEPPVDPEAEKEKKARNLKKKLRQARELREKKDKGESLLPEQFEKVIKINELIRQLDVLGFDPDGEPKEKTEAAAKSGA